MVAECLAEAGKPEAQKYIDQLRPMLPMEADACTARLLFRTGQSDEAAKLLAQIFRALQTDPWLSLDMTQHLLTLAEEIIQGTSDKELLHAIYDSLAKPFSAGNNDPIRLEVLLQTGMKLDDNQPGRFSMDAIGRVEPHVPWEEKLLRLRADCYRKFGDARLAQADRDLSQFVRDQPPQIKIGAPTQQPPKLPGDSSVTP
jgi:hypothetical protein